MYLDACLYYNSLPIPLISSGLELNILDINTDMLDCSKDPKKNRDWLAILRTLRKSKSIKRVLLYSNHSGRVAPIERVIPCITSHITVLELSGLVLGSATNCLASYLRRNTSIKKLVLSRTSIGDSNMRSLASAIRTMVKLSHLDLAQCNLTHSSAFCLASELKGSVQRHSEAWQSLLRESPYDDRQHQIPSSLEHLNISYNNLGSKGFTALINLFNEEIGLRGCPSNAALYLQSINITNNCARQALATIKANPNIYMLDIRNNNLEPTLLIDISNALALNPFDKHSKDMWKDPLQDTFHKIPVKVSSRMPTISSIEKTKKRTKPSKRNAQSMPSGVSIVSESATKACTPKFISTRVENGVMTCSFEKNIHPEATKKSIYHQNPKLETEIMLELSQLDELICQLQNTSDTQLSHAVEVFQDLIDTFDRVMQINAT